MSNTTLASDSPSFKSHLSAGQLLAWLPAVEVDPVEHLALTVEAAKSLLHIFPPILAMSSLDRPELVGDAELSAGLLKKIPPTSLVKVNWWPTDLPVLKVRTNCIMRQADFAERADSLWTLLPSILLTSSKAKDFAKALQVHPSQISRRQRHEK